MGGVGANVFLFMDYTLLYLPVYLMQNAATEQAGSVALKPSSVS